MFGITVETVLILTDIKFGFTNKNFIGKSLNVVVTILRSILLWHRDDKFFNSLHVNMKLFFYLLKALYRYAGEIKVIKLKRLEFYRCIIKLIS